MPTFIVWLKIYGQKKHTHNLFKSTNISLLFRSFKMNYVINYKLFVFFFVHIYIIYIWVLAGLFQRRLEYSFIIGSSHRKVSFFFFFFFSIWVFFHGHSRITGLQGKGEGIILTTTSTRCHFHLWRGCKLLAFSFNSELLCECFYAFCLHLFYRNILRWLLPLCVFF